MTLKTRFVLLFFVLCAGLGCGLFALIRYEHHESAEVLRGENSSGRRWLTVCSI